MSLDDVFDEGINCLLLAQLYLEEVCGWYGLPKEDNYTGLAYFQNTSFFLSVLLSETLREGDIFLVGPNNLSDYHKLHLAVFIGEYDQCNQPLLIHATNHSQLTSGYGGVVVTPFNKLQSLKKYQKLYGIRRLK